MILETSGETIVTAEIMNICSQNTCDCNLQFEYFKLFCGFQILCQNMNFTADFKPAGLFWLDFFISGGIYNLY